MEEEKEMERIKELIEKHRIQEEKRQAFKEKVDKMNEEYYAKIYQKMLYLEERDRQRKENMEKKRIENIIKNNIIAIKIEKRWNWWKKTRRKNLKICDFVMKKKRESKKKKGKDWKKKKNCKQKETKNWPKSMMNILKKFWKITEKNKSK